MCCPFNRTITNNRYLTISFTFSDSTVSCSLLSRKVPRSVNCAPSICFPSGKLVALENKYTTAATCIIDESALNAHHSSSGYIQRPSAFPVVTAGLPPRFTRRGKAHTFFKILLACYELSLEKMLNDRFCLIIFWSSFCVKTRRFNVDELQL